MEFLKRTWEEVFGLVVEDGSIALGAIGAVIAAGLIAWLAGDNQDVRNMAGPLLMMVILALVLVNVYVAGKNAARKRMR